MKIINDHTTESSSLILSCYHQNNINCDNFHYAFQRVSSTKINMLTLFKEIIPVYTENHTKHINTLCVQNAQLLNIKAVSMYGYHWTLKINY
jgi:hypothetical protein